MPEELLTVHEVATRLKVKDYTVRDWLRNGLLRGVKPGGRGWRVCANEVERRLAPIPEENPLEKALKTLERLSPVLSGGTQFSAVDVVNANRDERDQEIAGE